MRLGRDDRDVAVTTLAQRKPDVAGAKPAWD
jgi:hypothetical protein